MPIKSMLSTNQKKIKTKMNLHTEKNNPHIRYEKMLPFPQTFLKC